MSKEQEQKTRAEIVDKEQIQVIVPEQGDEFVPNLKISFNAWKEATEKLTYSAFQLYLYFATQFEEGKTSFTLEPKEIMKILGMSKATYYRAWKQLEDEGYIYVDNNTKCFSVVPFEKISKNSKILTDEKILTNEKILTDEKIYSLENPMYDPSDMSPWAVKWRQEQELREKYPFLFEPIDEETDRKITEELHALARPKRQRKHR